jgi:hypothetical protein
VTKPSKRDFYTFIIRLYFSAIKKKFVSKYNLGHFAHILILFLRQNNIFMIFLWKRKLDTRTKNAAAFSDLSETVCRRSDLAPEISPVLLVPHAAKISHVRSQIFTRVWPKLYTCAARIIYVCSQDYIRVQRRLHTYAAAALFGEKQNYLLKH